MSDVSLGDAGPDVVALQDLLRGIGFGANVGPSDGEFGPRTEWGVRCFQEAWTWQELAVDGVVGPQTSMALGICLAKHGRLSEHFSPWEFEARDTGEVRVLRGLLVGLERLRAIRGEPVSILSGYRTSAHNVRVGGALTSQHLYGAAADLRLSHDVDEVVALRVFSGIGYDRASSLVRHVDVRHLSEVNTTFGSPAVPTLWPYE